MIEEEENNSSKMRDWRNALRTPPAYRVVNRTLRSQTKFVTIIAIVGLVILLILYIFPKHDSITHLNEIEFFRSYNHSYPLSNPIITSSMYTFRIGKSRIYNFFTKFDKNATLKYCYEFIITKLLYCLLFRKKKIYRQKNYINHN